MKFVNHNNEIIYSDSYKASAIPAHIIGCEGYFNVFNTATNIKVARLEGETAELRLENDVTFSPAQLTDLAQLAGYIQNFF